MFGFQPARSGHFHVAATCAFRHSVKEKWRLNRLGSIQGSHWRRRGPRALKEMLVLAAGSAKVVDCYVKPRSAHFVFLGYRDSLGM